VLKKPVSSPKLQPHQEIQNMRVWKDHFAINLLQLQFYLVSSLKINLILVIS